MKDATLTCFSLKCKFYDSFIADKKEDRVDYSEFVITHCIACKEFTDIKY